MAKVRSREMQTVSEAALEAKAAKKTGAPLSEQDANRYEDKANGQLAAKKRAGKKTR